MFGARRTSWREPMPGDRGGGGVTPASSHTPYVRFRIRRFTEHVASVELAGVVVPPPRRDV